jgi:hypothetical protein
MRYALNACFEGEGPAASALGQGLATELAAALAARNISTGAVTVWRDTGSRFTCELNDWDIDVLLLEARGGRWNLQIAPSQPDGLFSKRGGTSPARGAFECYSIAQVVGEWLRGGGRFRDFRWRWHLPPRPEDPIDPHPLWATARLTGRSSGPA